MQNNYPKLLQKWLKDNHVEVLSWSAHLNPNVNLWNNMKPQLKDQKPSNLDELWLFTYIY